MKRPRACRCGMGTERSGAGAIGVGPKKWRPKYTRPHWTESMPASMRVTGGTDLGAIALDNRAHAAATIALGENAPPDGIGAFVLGYKCAAHGLAEPPMTMAYARECCAKGYARGADAEQRGRARELLPNGMRVVRAS